MKLKKAACIIVTVVLVATVALIVFFVLRDTNAPTGAESTKNTGSSESVPQNTRPLAWMDPAEFEPPVYSGLPGTIPFREVHTSTEDIWEALPADIYLEGIYRPGMVFELESDQSPRFAQSSVLQSGEKIENATDAQQLSVAFLQEQQRIYSMGPSFVPICVTHLRDRNLWLLSYDSAPMSQLGWVFVVVDGKDSSFVSCYFSR